MILRNFRDSVKNRAEGLFELSFLTLVEPKKKMQINLSKMLDYDMFGHLSLCDTLTEMICEKK